MATIEATKTAQCLRCGRALTSAASVSRGYGRTCSAKIKAAAGTADLLGFKAAQLASATELIEDGAIVPLRRTVFTVVSSDGTETYLSHPTNCTCPAGIKGHRCYHMAAARMLLAA